jgi:hypothetical protein
MLQLLVIIINIWMNIKFIQIIQVNQLNIMQQNKHCMQLLKQTKIND